MSKSDKRPWGKREIFLEESDYKVKRITVFPGHRLSYQKHAQRKEHWMFVAGEGKVTLESEVVAVSKNSIIDIEIGMAHRVENVGSVDLVFIELQMGSYLGEDDIERLEDDYGRK